MNRRDALRQIAGAIAAGTATLTGGRLDPHSQEATEVKHGADSADGTETTDDEDPGSAPDTEPDEDGRRANPDVAEQLYDAHSDRCMCPACSGSPPGNP